MLSGGSALGRVSSRRISVITAPAILVVGRPRPLVVHHEHGVGVRGVGQFATAPTTHRDDRDLRHDSASEACRTDRQGGVDRRRGEVGQRLTHPEHVVHPEDVAGGDPEQLATADGPDRLHGR